MKKKTNDKKEEKFRAVKSQIFEENVNKKSLLQFTANYMKEGVGYPGLVDPTEKMLSVSELK